MASSNSLFPEGNSIHRPPIFNGEGYHYWKTRMQIFIQSIDYNIWEAIELGPFIPTIVNESTSETNVSALEKPRVKGSTMKGSKEEQESRDFKLKCTRGNYVIRGKNNNVFIYKSLDSCSSFEPFMVLPLTLALVTSSRPHNSITHFRDELYAVLGCHNNLALSCVFIGSIYVGGADKRSSTRSMKLMF